MDAAFKVYPEHEFVIESFAGRITREELWIAILSSWEDPHYQPHFSGMSDLRQAHIGMSVEEFRDLESALFAHPKKAQGRWFWLSDAPLATAYGLLHEQAAQARTPFIVTSTWEAGCTWAGKHLPEYLLTEVGALRQPLLKL